MSEFFIDLLPDDARTIFRRRAHLRLVKLGAALVLTITTGVAFDSVVQIRKARAEHDVIVALRDRAGKIDELVGQALQERTVVRCEIAADAMLRSPVAPSSIIATLSHLLPEGSWLESMRISLEEQKAGKIAPTNRPVYLITMSGIASSAQDVQDFASDLRKNPPFAAVTIDEQRAAPKSGGGSEQQFKMRARIDPSMPAATVSDAARPWTKEIAMIQVETNGGNSR